MYEHRTRAASASGESRRRARQSPSPSSGPDSPSGVREAAWWMDASEMSLGYDLIGSWDERAVAGAAGVGCLPDMAAPGAQTDGELCYSEPSSYSRRSGAVHARTAPLVSACPIALMTRLSASATSTYQDAD